MSERTLASNMLRFPRMWRRIPIVVIVALSPAADLGAAPLENLTTNSARFAALAGASVSAVRDGNSVLMNPAGLSFAGEEEQRGYNLILNLAPALIQNKAPVVRAEESITSKTIIAPIFDLAAAYRVSSSLGIGAGVSVAGGQGTDYGNVAFNGYPLEPEVKLMIGSIEGVLGASYSLTSRWSVGASWRVSLLSGESRSARILPDGTLQALAFTDLSGSNFSGFRVGTRYEGGDRRWALGAAIRTGIDWEFSGDASTSSATVDTSSPESPLGDAELGLAFPAKYSVGGNFRLGEQLGVFLQYDFAQYSKDDVQKITVAGAIQDVKLDWNDVHAFHVGVEYPVQDDGNWSARAGYLFETQAVPADYPQVVGVAPGPIHGFCLGAGAGLSESVRIDGSAVFQTNSGRGEPAPDSPALPGDYRIRTLTLALSLTAAL